MQVAVAFAVGTAAAVPLLGLALAAPTGARMRTPVTVGVVCGSNGLGDDTRAGVRRAAAGDAALDLRRRARGSSSIGYGPATAWTRDFDELLQDEDLDAIAFASAELAGRGRALAALESRRSTSSSTALLDSSSAEADKLVAAAARGNRRLLAQAPVLLRPEVLRLHRLIDRGALGEIFYVHARRYALRPELELDLLRDLGARRWSR